MFRTPRTPPCPPAIDLATVRETLHYMHDDMKRVPGLEAVAAAMQTTLAEIEMVERQANQSRPAAHPANDATFMPMWR